jgi:sugar phosphate permease
MSLKFATYGIMLWLPLYLQMTAGYSDYESSIVSSMYDLGTITGSLLIGYLTDMTYSRRNPVTFVCLILATFI